ncbi:MAG: PIG-L deacetylase family protein [Actinomycetota bacterium]
MDNALDTLPEDWERALAIVAHPDDLEYGAAAAVARWTGQGKDVRYLLATRGEAGIDSIPPEEAGPLRTREQEDSAAVVGVSVVEFMDHADGLVVNGIELRRDLAAAIRRHRPDVIIGSNYRQRWGDTGPWNHSDHRALGMALPDATRDAGNRWLFTDAGEPWDGVRWIAFTSSTAPTHAVDVTDTIGAGVASLECHRTYIDAVGDPDFDPDSFLRGAASAAGPRIGVELAVTFELVPA